MDLFPRQQVGDRVAHDDHTAGPGLPVDGEGGAPRLECNVAPTQSQDLGYATPGVVQEADEGLISRMCASLQELLDLFWTEEVRRQLLPRSPAVLRSD